MSEHLFLYYLNSVVVYGPDRYIGSLIAPSNEVNQPIHKEFLQK